MTDVEATTAPRKRRDAAPRVVVLFSAAPERVATESAPPALETAPARGAPTHVPPTDRHVALRVHATAMALSSHGLQVSVVNMEDDPARLTAALAVQRPDMVFNVVEEIASDTLARTQIPAVLALNDVAVTGSDEVCLGTAIDRVRTRILLRDAGLSVPRFAVVRDLNAVPATSDFAFPVILTQALDDVYGTEGTDHGLRGRQELLDQVAVVAYDFELPFLVEEHLGARRFHLVVLGNQVLECLPITAAGADITAANLAQLPAGTARSIRGLGRRAFKTLGCRDYAMIDFHLDADDAPFVTDVRPMLSDSEAAHFELAAASTERGFDGTIAEIVRLAFRREHELDAVGFIERAMDT